MKLHFSLIDTLSILVSIIGAFTYGLNLGSKFSSDKLEIISKIVFWIMIVIAWVFMFARR